MPAAVLAALLLSACGGGGKDETTTAAGPQRLDVIACDFALKINGSPALRPGPVQTTARNSGEQAHGMVLVKLNDGVDQAALLDALKNRPDRIASLLTYVGGTTVLPKGGLLAGDDVVRPGQLRDARRTVSGRKVAAPTANQTAEVALYDYGIYIPKAIPANGQIKVENTGEDDHQLAVIPVKNANEAKTILRAFKTGRRKRTTYRPVEVLAPTSAATSTTVRYQLPKGAYIAYCAYRTQRSGGRPPARPRHGRRVRRELAR